MLKNLPLKRPRPDSNLFIRQMLGEKTNGRVPLVEYIIDDIVLQPVIEGLLQRVWVPPSIEIQQHKKYLDNFISFWHLLGYDNVRYEEGLNFLIPVLETNDVGPDKNKKRIWADEHSGLISNWQDFADYPWPTIQDKDFFNLEYINSHLPDGMGLLTCHAGGVFEHLSKLLSYEGLCLLIFDDEKLVQAVVDKVGELLLEYYERLLQLDRVVAIFQGDDMGYRSGTMIGPEHLRKYCLPWLAKLSAKVHAADKPFFLHSCGNILPIMTDLLDAVKIDGKHSFEDAIIPAENFHERYGNRIATLGGVDINILAAGTTDAVRKRTRELIKICGNRGRFAIGSGNSIPSYIPPENYLAMVDEALD